MLSGSTRTPGKSSARSVTASAFSRAWQVHRDHADGETRNVARQDVTRPVDDAATFRRHRQPHDPVLLRELVVVVPTDDLEVVQPRGQPGEDENDRDPEGDEAPDRDEGAFVLPHQTPNAPCFSVTRRRSRATG